MANLYLPLADKIVRHNEGEVLKAYKDSKGIWTIGVGHNLIAYPLTGRTLSDLMARGITPAESEALLLEDLSRAEADAMALCPVFHILSPLRQAILIDLSFNLGKSRLSKFFGFWGAVVIGDEPKAAYELLDSQYQRDVKGRAWRNAIMWATDAYME